MADRKLEVILTGDSKRLEAALGRGEKKVHSFGAVGVAAGALIAGGLGLAVKDVIGDFMAGEKASAQTAAVLKSTGGVANITAGQVEGLASAIAHKSGMDDAAIQSGENMLLTFTNIQNKAGEGNDIFNQATSIMADMSAAMGTDMKGQAIQLGKALNDPVKGIGALTKVGVTFTDQQKEQIAAMVKSGDTAGAQGVILAELNKEFGGSAEAAGKTLGGQLSILKGKFEDMGGVVLAKVIPVLTAVSAWAADHVGLIVSVGSAIGVAAAAFLLYSSYVKIAAAAQMLMNLTWEANPVGIVIIAIAALVAGIILLYQNSETARRIIDAAMAGIKSAALSAFGWITDTAVPAVIGAWNSMHPVIEALKAIVMLHFNAIKAAIQTAISIIVPLLHGDFGGALDAAKAAVAALLAKVGAVFAAVPGVIRAAIPIIGSAALAVGSKVLSEIGSGIGSLGSMIGNKIGDLKDGLVRAVKSVAGDAKDVGAAILEGIKKGVGDLAGWVEDKAKAAVNGVIRLFNSAVRSGVSRLNSAVQFSFDTHVPGLGTVSFNPPDISAPQIPQLAAGGIVTRPTLAIIGEDGPEMVTPLKGGMGAGDVHVHLHQVTTDADPTRIAWATVWAMRSVSV